MIHAEQIQYRGVKVVDRNRLLLRPVTKLVAGSDHLAALIFAPAIHILMAPGL